MVDADFAERVLAQAQQVDEPAVLWADRTVLDAKAAEWRAYGIKSPGLVAAQRFLEIELAQWLGPKPGSGGDHKSVEYRSNNHDYLIPAMVVSNLRRMYGYADFARGIVRDRLAADKMPPSLRRLIADVEAAHRPRTAPPETPPDSRQHFDVWSFPTADAGLGPSRFFGRMPSQVVENLLWFWTEPGQMVVDPFAGSGTTLRVAEWMGRFVWASDLHPTSPAIHEHDITTGWPDAAPAEADLIVLDPPYWKQAAGRYSDDDRDLGNQSLVDFMASWRRVVSVCVPHLADGGRLAFIVSPTEDGTHVVDHAFDMYEACRSLGLVCERRVIVTYQTQQATGQQVLWARENRRLLKLYRDLVVMRAPA
jgi:hypothetical protein